VVHFHPLAAVEFLEYRPLRRFQPSRSNRIENISLIENESRNEILLFLLGKWVMGKL